MSSNPYAAPKAAVADETIVLSADFVPAGRSLPAGRGRTWIGTAWELFKRQPGLWIGMWLLLMVIFIGASMIPILGGLLTMLFWPVFMAGIALGCRALDEGKDLELGHLFAGFRERTGTLIGVGALYLVATVVITLAVIAVVGVSVFTMANNPEAMAGAGGATILLAVLISFALMLPVVMAIWFAPPLVVFQQQGAWEAMKTSFFGCLRNIVPFLIYGLVFLGLAIVATIPLLLGWLIVGPMISISVYTGYRDIYFTPKA